MEDKKINNRTFYKKQRDIIHYKVNEYYNGTKSRLDVLTDFIVCCIKLGKIKIFDSTAPNSGHFDDNIV